jgi:hypothetical protein
MTDVEYFEPQDHGSYSTPTGNEDVVEPTNEELMRAHLRKAFATRALLALVLSSSGTSCSASASALATLRRSQVVRSGVTLLARR